MDRNKLKKIVHIYWKPVGEVGAMPKLLNLGTLKVDAEFPYSGLHVANGSLGYWLSNAQNIFGKFIFCWVYELNMGKIGIASKLREKPKTVNFWGAKPKITL